MSELSTSIRDYIVHNFLFDDEASMPPDDTSLLTAGIIDSTGVLDLLAFVEDQFVLEVAAEDLTPDNFDSVDHLAAYVQSKLAAPV